jgi:hypothetical protein
VLESSLPTGASGQSQLNANTDIKEEFEIEHEVFMTLVETLPYIRVKVLATTFPFKKLLLADESAYQRVFADPHSD